jgi:nitroimidazol reductase NimA-like FMN-containing flavoprotein (pyridoxamine 5'-phosphate oxidase superfamily)
VLIKEMTAKECGDFLARIHFGRLGCSFDNEPYVVPIYFAYQPDHLFAFSTVGRNIEWMRANPKVCIEADEVTDHFYWTSVIVSGHYQELPDTQTAQSELEQPRSGGKPLTQPSTSGERASRSRPSSAAFTSPR